MNDELVKIARDCDADMARCLVEHPGANTYSILLVSLDAAYRLGLQAAPAAPEEDK